MLEGGEEIGGPECKLNRPGSLVPSLLRKRSHLAGGPFYRPTDTRPWCCPSINNRMAKVAEREERVLVRCLTDEEDDTTRCLYDDISIKQAGLYTI